jgi:hypothetical protein
MKQSDGCMLEVKQHVKQIYETRNIWWNVRRNVQEKNEKCPQTYWLYPRYVANRNTSSLWASSLLWREETFLSLSSLITIGLANEPSGWSSGKFCNRTSLLWLIQLISLFVCWQIWIGFGSALCKCYDLQHTVDTTCRVWTLFIFLSNMFWQTFHYMFYSLFHPLDSLSVSHVVSLPTYFHPLVSFNNILTLIYLTLYAGFSYMFHLYIDKDSRYINYSN